MGAFPFFSLSEHIVSMGAFSFHMKILILPNEELCFVDFTSQISGFKSDYKHAPNKGETL
jgi:hypothetical protein